MTSAPLTSLKQNGCCCGREAFFYAGISEDELGYSCTASFQKTVLQTSNYKAVYLRMDQETGCLCKGKSSGTPPVSEEKVERVRETLTRSPRKSTTHESLHFQMPQQTVWKILWKTLRMFPYKLQLEQTLSCDDRRVRYSLCLSM